LSFQALDQKLVKSVLPRVIYDKFIPIIKERLGYFVDYQSEGKNKEVEKRRSAVEKKE